MANMRTFYTFAQSQGVRERGEYCQPIHRQHLEIDYR